MARALIVAVDQLQRGAGDAAFLRAQGRDRALLRGPHSEQSPRHARRRRRGRRERDGARA